MGVTHTNRRGKPYYLHGREDKGGRVRYSFSTKKDARYLVDEIPQGYEVFEKVESAQVFLRRVRKSAFTEVELELIERAIITWAPTARTEVKDDTLVVYDRSPVWEDISPSDTDRFADYTAVFSFVLRETSSRRKFSVRRWHFSLDTWRWLEDGALAALLERFLPHVGKESFFQLDTS